MRRVWLVAVALGLSASSAGGSANDCAIHPPHGPDANGYWGFSVGLYPAEAERRGFAFPPDFEELRSTGARDVVLPVSFRQEGVTAVELLSSPDTLPDATLRHVIRDAHEARLGVVLLPLVDLVGGGPGEWRGVLRPANVDAWWRSYTRFLLHYAELAQTEGVEMLVIGSELSSLSGPGSEARWAGLTRSVRATYDGPLAYGANHDALDLRAPFAFVDVVGVSAYFPLTRSKDGRSGNLYAESWRRIARRLARLRRELDKPLVLLEVGYASVADATQHPWDYTSSMPIDLEEQRAAYAALTDVALDADWLDGVLFWNWLGPGGAHDRWYTPRGKPAMAEATRLLRGRTGR